MAKKSERNKGNRGFVEGHDRSIGRNDYAGLPREVVMKEFPKNKMHPGAYLDDSISDIDAIQDDSVRQMQSRLSNQK